MNKTHKLSKAQTDFLAMLDAAGGKMVFEGIYSGYVRPMNVLRDKGLITVSIEQAPHINIYTVEVVR